MGQTNSFQLAKKSPHLYGGMGCCQSGKQKYGNLKSIFWSSIIQNCTDFFFVKFPSKLWLQIESFPYWIKLLDLIATISSTLILRSLLATEPAATSVELVSSFLTNISNLLWPTRLALLSLLSVLQWQEGL